MGDRNLSQAMAIIEELRVMAEGILAERDALRAEVERLRADAAKLVVALRLIADDDGAASWQGNHASATLTKWEAANG